MNTNAKNAKDAYASMNRYEFADRAMQCMESLRCGPDGKECDGGLPTYTCPAHGGDGSMEDNWSDADQQAYDTFGRAWSGAMGYSAE